jgi:hypothetical protein
MANPEPEQPSSGITSTPSAHSIVVQTAIEVIGVGLMAIFADMSDNVGRLMLVLMVGFFLIWFFMNLSFWQSIVSKA